VEAAVGHLGAPSIHTPIAFLRSTGAVLGPIWKGSQRPGGTFAPSFRRVSNKPITADHISGHRAPAHRKTIQTLPGTFLVRLHGS
jgi:hypothetical protein